MLKITEVGDEELLWIELRALAFELRAGKDIVGNLRFERQSLAAGETADHQWTFKREGFWHARITVRLPGSDANVALFHPGWVGGGRLELGPGKEVRFVAANFWRSDWNWVDEINLPLVHFKRHGGLFTLESQVTIEDRATALQEMPLLVVLGWYLLALSAQDAQVGAGGP